MSLGGLKEGKGKRTGDNIRRRERMRETAPFSLSAVSHALITLKVLFKIVSMRYQ